MRLMVVTPTTFLSLRVIIVLTGLSTRIGYHTEAHGIPEKYYELPGSTW